MRQNISNKHGRVTLAGYGGSRRTNALPHVKPINSQTDHSAYRPGNDPIRSLTDNISKYTASLRGNDASASMVWEGKAMK